MNRPNEKKSSHRNSSNFLSSWIPVIIGVVFIAVSLFIWRALVVQEHAHIRQVIELRAKDLKTNTERLLESQAQALLRMVRRWEKQGKTPKDEWELDARLYVTHYSFYQAIEWADASFHVRWIVPLEGNEKAQDLNLAFEKRRRTALEKARDRQEITVTRTIDLVQGEKGFLVNLPIFLGKDFDGFILGVFRINKLFSFLLTDKDLSRYSIAVYDDEEKVYSHESHNRENGDKWSIEKEVKFHNLTWRILIWPSQELFAELQSVVPEIALITGLFLSLFIALTAYFFQKALLRAKDVEITNQSLLHEITERRQAEDRTKHKQLEDSLRESEERLRAILDNTTAVIYMKDIQGRYLLINRQFEILLNITRDQIRNRTDKELFPAEIAGALQANDRKVLESKIPLEFEEIVPIDDRQRTYLSIKFPLFNSTGAISAICGISTDITERKRMDEIVRNIAEGVAAKTGKAFFQSLVLHVAKMLNVDYVMVYKLIPESNEVETIALCANGGISDNLVYTLAGTPCEKVLEKGLLMYYENPQQQFPEDHSLAEMGVKSYMGIPLTDSSNYPLGLLVIMRKKELKEVELAGSLLKIFAVRASAELERDRVEKTLQESEARLSEAQRIAHIGSWEWDIIKNKTHHSDEVYRIFGRSPQEFGNTYDAFLSHVHPDDRELVRKSVDGALYERRPYVLEYRIFLKDKTVRFIQEKAIVMFDTMGIRPVRMVGTLQDITEIKQAREEMNLLKTIFMEVGVSKDLHEALIITIRKVCEMAGFVYGEAWKPAPDGEFLERDHAFYSVDEGLSKFSLFTEGMTFPRNTGLPGRARSKKQPVWIRDLTQDPEYLRTQIGGEIGFKMGVAFPVIANDEVVTVIVFYQKEAKESDERLVNLISTVVAQLSPMIRHKQIEEALRESEERFRQLAENIRQVFWMATPQMNQIFYVSPAYEEIWGRTCKSLYEFPGTWFESIHPPDRDKVLIIFQEKRIQTMLDIKYRIVRPDGSIRWIQSQAFPVCNKSGEIYRIVGISEDISEIKQTEEEQSRLREQLERVSRLESIGKLAGGIAHDFNNILTVISGYGQLLNKELKEDDPLKAYIKKIITSAERAVQLTQGLLAFSRKQVTNPKPVEINETIRSSEGLMRRLLGEDIQLTIILVDRKCVVMADSGQIEQVLMNLATNARDAMPHGGEIVIHTNIVELDNEYRKTYGYGVFGNYFLISFSDTGEGMDKEARERIFEPYFTTKGVGKGTGLGLSIVYGIVKQHNGYINAYSEPGKGTLFKIYLPLIESEVDEQGPETHTPATGGAETILLAEDELEVRNLMKTILERNGYKVIEATDGEEAIQKFMEHKDEIELLVFDVVMPKRSGKSAYDTIKKMNPDVKILFMSGYSEDILHKRGVIVEKGLKYATKPIFPTELLKIIRELLDKPSERNT